MNDLKSKALKVLDYQVNTPFRYTEDLHLIKEIATGYLDLLAKYEAVKKIFTDLDDELRPIQERIDSLKKVRDQLRYGEKDGAK